ncbi:MAG: hypothetical protein IT383_02050 [Deltaproteobacteria bacterium]|nr:hypothetical protein [Deltaproteobacteria bacterium]
MRIVAVDARERCEQARMVVALALAQAPERIFLFGATAVIAAAQVAHELSQRDERYLDVAARWLLEHCDGPPPTRAGLEVPLLEVGIAVRDDDSCAPLPVSARAIELVGAHLCMAVPDRERIAPDEWDNAALWIAGGADRASVHEQMGHALVVAGDAALAAGPAVIDLSPTEAQVAFLDPRGALVERRVLKLGGAPRFTVKAAGGAHG